MCDLTEKQILTGAAILAHSNMGQERPTKEQAQMVMMYANDAWNLESYVCAVSGHLFESDEHLEIFLDEARGWERQIRDNVFAAHHKDVLELLQ